MKNQQVLAVIKELMRQYDKTRKEWEEKFKTTKGHDEWMTRQIDKLNPNAK